MRRSSDQTSGCRLSLIGCDLSRIGFERQSVASKIVLEVEESRDLFTLKELRRGLSKKPLIYNRFLNVTFRHGDYDKAVSCLLLKPKSDCDDKAVRAI